MGQFSAESSSLPGPTLSGNQQPRPMCFSRRHIVRVLSRAKSFQSSEVMREGRARVWIELFFVGFV